MKIGVLLYLIYFLLILILREKIVNYIWLLGIIYGLADGFYYSVFDILMTNGIDNSDRVRYLGMNTFFSNIISIIFPLIFGGLSSSLGFINSSFLAIIIAILQIIFSNCYLDNDYSNLDLDFNGLKNISRENDFLKRICKSRVCAGLTYDHGALSYVITLYIVKVFNDNISSGVFTSIFCFISSIIGILVIKKIKVSNYVNLLTFASFLTIVFLLNMLFNYSYISVVLFNLFYTIFLCITKLIDKNNFLNYSNIIKNYKVEYFFASETCLFIGRIISNGLFLLVLFIDIKYIMIIFILFIIFSVISSVRMQLQINKCDSC